MLCVSKWGCQKQILPTSPPSAVRSSTFGGKTTPNDPEEGSFVGGMGERNSKLRLWSSSRKLFQDNGELNAVINRTEWPVEKWFSNSRPIIRVGAWRTEQGFYLGFSLQPPIPSFLVCNPFQIPVSPLLPPRNLWYTCHVTTRFLQLQ